MYLNLNYSINILKTRLIHLSNIWQNIYCHVLDKRNFVIYIHLKYNYSKVILWLSSILYNTGEL